MWVEMANARVWKTEYPVGAIRKSIRDLGSLVTQIGICLIAVSGFGNTAFPDLDYTDGLVFPGHPGR